MTTAGQAAGYVVGGVVGAFVPAVGWVIGAQIGGMIGGYIDPPKGQSTVGPRLEDLAVQTSTYGAVIPRVKGTISVTGNVFWMEGNKYKEHENKQKSGGKGGGSKATSTTFSYSATFGVSLAHCVKEPVVGIRRLWLANRLVYDAGSSDVSSIIASNLQDNVVFKFYDGRDEQEPDPRMQADKGAANVSGHPGRCWIAFYDLDLTEHYSNALMATQVTVELVCAVSGDGVGISPLVQVSADSSGTETKLNNVIFNQSSLEYSVFRRDTWNGNVTDVFFYKSIFGESERLTQSVSTGIGTTTICRQIPVCQSDDVVALLETAPASPYETYSVLTKLDKNGRFISTAQIAVADFNIYKDKTAAIDGDDWFIASREGLPLYKFSSANIINQTASSYSILSLGLSESYVFGVKFESINTATITVYLFDRESLSLIDTWYVSGNSKQAALQVVSDSEIYIAVEGGDVINISSGSVINDLGAIVPTSFNDTPNVLPGWFSVFSSDPPYVLSTSNSPELNDYVYAGHPHYSAAPAKLHDIITDECALAGIDAADLDLTELTNHDVRGYKIGTLGSSRSALEPLQAAFPFDVIQSGYKIKFKDRGTDSVLTIPESDLGAHAGGDSLAALLPNVIEMPSQIASKVAIKFYNAARDYDIDEQPSSNRAGDSKQSRTINLPIVFTPDEALQAADVLLKKEWVERRAFGPFTLPPTEAYRKLESADVVTVQYKGRDITLRITKITDLPNGIRECEGRLTSSAAYSSSAIAQEPLVLGQSLVPLRGTTRAVLLDIPRIVSAQDAPGISAALYGQASGWPGGVLMRSDDSGQTWPSMTGFADKSEVFTAVDVLGAGRADIVDASSSITVTPNWSGADLYSITEAQLFSGGNLAAFGADGRWEIIGFKTVIDNTGSYTIRDFARGRYGTEWAAALHQIGDQLVMLNTTDTEFIGLPLSALNSSRLWRAVTSGASIDSAADVPYAYSGVNLKPLSPVYANVTRDPATFDSLITFIPRSRTPVEPFSGLATPIGETVASYEVEIWDSAYSTRKRLFSGLTSPSVNYSIANQIVDFGVKQETLYLRIYQLSPTVGRGYPLQVSVTRYLDDDPYRANVSLLIHCNGTNGSTTFIDQCGRTVTPTGDAQISTAQSVFGGASASFGGTGFLTVTTHSSLQLGTGDFTIEGRVRLSSVASAMGIIDRRSALQARGLSIFFDTAGGNKLRFCVGDTSPAGWEVSISSGFVVANTWYGFSFQKVGNVYTARVDGVSVGSVTWSGTPADDTSNWLVGSIWNANFKMIGNVDELRLTREIGRYPADYSLATTEFHNP